MGRMRVTGRTSHPSTSSRTTALPVRGSSTMPLLVDGRVGSARPSGLAVHHATCSNSQFYREHQWQNEETDERDPIAVAEDTDEQNDPSTATGGESPGERRTFSYRV